MGAVVTFMFDHLNFYRPLTCEELTSLTKVKLLLTLAILNIFMYYTPPQFFYPVNLQHSSCKLVFSIRVDNSVDPDQLASSEAS